MYNCGGTNKTFVWGKCNLTTELDQFFIAHLFREKRFLGSRVSLIFHKTPKNSNFCRSLLNFLHDFYDFIMFFFFFFYLKDVKHLCCTHLEYLQTEEK